MPPFFIDCPTQPIVVANGNPCGNLVDFDLPIGKDICTPDDELRYSGSYDTTTLFQIGTTTFPYRVTDKSGNFVECSITITIMGEVPHFENVPDTIFVAMCSTLVSWPPLIPVGFCPPITVDSTHTPGSVFPFGTTTVTYTASDSLNTATATFLVIVSEDVEPVFDCPVSPIVVNVGGVIVSDQSNFLISADTAADCRGVELTFDLPNATDNCVTPTVTQLQGLPSGSVFLAGVFYDLIFRAVDSSGNLSQCAVFIEVTGLPDLDPVVNPNPACTGDSVLITASNIPGAIYTWTGPVISTTNIVTINNLSVLNDGLYIVTANVNGCNTAPDSTEVFLTLPPEAEDDLYTLDPGETITFPSVLINDFLSPSFDFYICDASQLPGLVNNNDGTFTYTAGDEPDMVSFYYAVCSNTCDIEDQAVVTITINDTKCSFIPNIITPNGDDTNDWLEIPCLDTGLFRDNSLVIYSQWGDKVFEANPYISTQADGWYGTLDGEIGKDLPDGVYYYIFKPGQNISQMKGFVQIFR